MNSKRPWLSRASRTKSPHGPQSRARFSGFMVTPPRPRSPTKTKVYLPCRTSTSQPHRSHLTIRSGRISACGGLMSVPTKSGCTRSVPRRVQEPEQDAAHLARLERRSHTIALRRHARKPEQRQRPDEPARPRDGIMPRRPRPKDRLSSATHVPSSRSRYGSAQCALSVATQCLIRKCSSTCPPHKTIPQIRHRTFRVTLTLHPGIGLTDLTLRRTHLEHLRQIRQVHLARLPRDAVLTPLPIRTRQALDKLVNQTALVRRELRAQGLKPRLSQRMHRKLKPYPITTHHHGRRRIQNRPTVITAHTCSLSAQCLRAQ